MTWKKCELKQQYNTNRTLHGFTVKVFPIPCYFAITEGFFFTCNMLSFMTCGH